MAIKKKKEGIQKTKRRVLSKKKTSTKLLKIKGSTSKRGVSQGTAKSSTIREPSIDEDKGPPVTSGRIGKVPHKINSTNLTQSKDARSKKSISPPPPNVHYPEHFLKNNALRK